MTSKLIRPKQILKPYPIGLYLFCISLAAIQNLPSSAQYIVHTEDIPRFWATFDQVMATTDSAAQVRLIQTNYLDKGSIGLKEFNSLRNGTAINYRNFILRSSERLKKIRSNTLTVIEQKAALDARLAYFKEIYPQLKLGEVFFTIGIGNSGGTVKDNHVLIGCEVAASDSANWAVSLTIHEFVHTQQKSEAGFNLLSQCLKEGAADFIMELVMQKPIPSFHPRGYIDFGIMNETELWQKFKRVMFATNDESFGWLYGQPGVEIAGFNKADMGYAMGYLICRKYYRNSPDKAKAISDIINLAGHKEAARNFILASGYLPAEDITYVTNTPFSNYKPPVVNVEKRPYGVWQTADSVVFVYEAPATLAANYIQQVTLAGSFNNWNQADSQYKMHAVGQGKYRLSLPKTQLKKDDTYAFKFVVNENDWLEAPASASNTDGSEYNNLVVTVQ